jgi:serine O-acetyltransferase
MNLIQWLNNETPIIVNSLNSMNKSSMYVKETIGEEGKKSIYNILYNLRCALFFNVQNKDKLEAEKFKTSTISNLNMCALELNNLILKISGESELDDEKNSYMYKEQRANKIVIQLMKKLPHICKVLQKDIEAAYKGDPAATTFEEIFLSYPSLEATSIHRIAHELYKMDVPIIPRVMSEYAHQSTGIDIHPGAKIGESFFIDHGTGVVIGETCIIGNRVKLYQGVTLGAKSFSADQEGTLIKNVKRHPNIEDDVVVYAGATILGGDTTIGKNSVIGGNVWLTHSVPPHSKVYNTKNSAMIKEEASFSLNL